MSSLTLRERATLENLKTASEALRKKPVGAKPDPRLEAKYVKDPLGFDDDGRPFADAPKPQR